MSATNLNIRIDKEVKEQAEMIFNALGLNMTTAVNMFLRQAIMENGIPFAVKLSIPNATTLSALNEGKKIMSDGNAIGFSDMATLKTEIC